MYVVIIILTVIIALLLIGIVLIQKSKGGGLSSQFGGAGAVMGVRQTNSFLEKTTWTLISLLAPSSAHSLPRLLLPLLLPPDSSRLRLLPLRLRLLRKLLPKLPQKLRLQNRTN